MSKLSIWVVDDNDDQRTAICANLIPSQIGLLDETRKKHAEDLFNIVEFSSAREAEEQLTSIFDEKDFPDFLISDNNFQHSREQKMEDKAPDRGLNLLEFIRNRFPHIPVALITSFEVLPYLERLKEMTQSAPLDFANCVFGIQKKEMENSFLMDGNQRLNNVLKQIAAGILNRVSHPTKLRLSQLASSKECNVNTLLAEEIQIDHKTYVLSSLLGAWAFIDPQKDIQYDEIGLRRLLTGNQDLNLPNLPKFNGQLAKHYSNFNNLNTTPKIAFLANQVRNIIVQDQTELIKKIIPDVVQALKYFFETNRVWTEALEFTADNIQNILAHNPPCENPHLQNLRHICGDAGLEFRHQRDDETQRQKWENILRCRLAIIGIFALRGRNVILQECPFALDFAVHVLLRKNPSDFFGVLRRQMFDFPKNIEGINPIDTRYTLVKYINTLLGLSRSFTISEIIRGKECEYHEEQLPMEYLFPAEQQFYNDIMGGQYLSLLGQ